jgi:N-acetylmuramoyl-L-alanine amidase
VTRPARLATAVLLLAAAGRIGLGADAPTARDVYAAARAREEALRHSLDSPGAHPSVQSFRSVVAAYESVVRRFPTCNCADSALWRGAEIADEAFGRFGDARDRATARRLLAWLATEYPSSPRAAKARDTLKRAEGAVVLAPHAAEGPAAPPGPPPAILHEIRRTVLADRVRVSLELTTRVPYRTDRLENPPRAVVDLPGARLGPAVPEGTLTYPNGAVRHVRVIRLSDGARVIVDLEQVARYSISTPGGPADILIDCELARPSVPAAPAPAQPTPIVGRTLLAAALTAPALPALEPAPAPLPEPVPGAASPARASPGPDGAGPSAPARNNTFSLARQLGLGASKIVIDAGHGGHDPGAIAGGVYESHLVLDVALRLEQLLRDAGFAVVLTRRDDTFVSLEQRTAIANREQGDLFLSIHANASRNPSVRGIESYVLNFATDPDAEAVAARENAATDRTMSALSEMVRAITLNSKLDESRRLAGFVERALATRLDRVDKGTPDHGVKQAPFVVLIGASMPSVLVEISFLTNPQDAQLLRTEAYRQTIAQALFDAIGGYHQSLKGVRAATR